MHSAKKEHFYHLHSLFYHPDYLFYFMIITKIKFILWRKEMLKIDPHQMSDMLGKDHECYFLHYSYFLGHLEASLSLLAETCP